MTMASVHRCGFFVVALLLCAAGVAFLIDVQAGIILSVPLLVASLGAADAVRLYQTRKWPRVEADAVDKRDASGRTAPADGSRAATRYPQQVSYSYRGQRHDASLTWSTYPPSQVVLRVNPDHPAEVFCLEHAGDSWASFLLVALLLPLAVGITVGLGLGRLPRFLTGLAVLGGIAWWGRRLHPVDRADTFASHGMPATWGRR